jgi:predicted RNA-binding Zn ribbon-like protein
MLFAHDTVAGLHCATDLVNTEVGDEDLLGDVEALAYFFDSHGFTGQRQGTADELRSVRALRPRLRAAWTDPGPAEVAALVNQLLTQADARPLLTRHDDWDWHIHATAPEAPLAHRIAAESAMALADLVRLQELDRLRLCEADDCGAVLVDLSRNHSRRYCDTGNCGNRQHVAAYRARRRGDRSDAGAGIEPTS